MPSFAGFDHLDVRVRALDRVEPFYDRLMPLLGMPVKSYAHVDADGEWHSPSDDRPSNAVEYYEAPDPRRPVHFIGFIEDRAHIPSSTRIAFAAVDRAEVEAWFQRLGELGARNIERSADMDAYCAVFFEDPARTCLEICARRPRPAENSG